ncbi:MAG: zinc ribbon domain-containing protein [Clostridia bacterium]|nr:zinc ribbon domain-containing protein [Clostridia bacterium]
MPIYEFKCKKCGHKFEELCRFGQTDIHCPRCGEAGPYRLVSTFSMGNTGAGGEKSCASCSGGSCSSCR